MSKLPTRETRKPLSPRTEAALSVIQALFPVLASLATAIWVVNGYFGQQKDANLARLVEARKSFNEKQFKTYTEVAAITGLLISRRVESFSAEQLRRLEALLSAEIPMVADTKVEEATRWFLVVAQKYQSIQSTTSTFNADTLLLDELTFRGKCLAYRLRNGIESSWLIDLQPKKKEPLDTGDVIDSDDKCHISPWTSGALK